MRRASSEPLGNH